MGGQVVEDQPEAGRAVVVVGIDDRKGRVDAPGGGQHRVGGAPGLDAAFRHRKALRQHVQLLEGVAHLQAGLPGAGAHRPLELGLDLVLDDEHHGGKSRPAGVVQAVIQDGLAAGAHRVDLLQPAVAAAHAGSHHNKNRFFHMANAPSLQKAFCLYHTHSGGPWQGRHGAKRGKTGGARLLICINNLHFA